MLPIEQFYERFSAHGLLDAARFRFMPSGRFLTVSGTFRDRPFNALGGDFADAAPTFKCPLSLIDGIKQDDEVRIRGVDYVVKGADPDDRGEVLLKLEVA